MKAYSWKCKDKAEESAETPERDPIRFKKKQLNRVLKLFPAKNSSNIFTYYPVGL